MLIEIAKRLWQQSRAADTVARYGGEEFVILLPETSSEYVAAVGERIRASLVAAPIVVHGDITLDVTASVGVASSEGHRADPETLIRAADEALYAAKHRGRNQVVAATVVTDAPRPVGTEHASRPASAA